MSVPQATMFQAAAHHCSGAAMPKAPSFSEDKLNTTINNPGFGREQTIGKAMQITLRK